MRWIRSNVRFGAWCALFALTLQLGLSFGHVHADGGLKAPRLGLAVLLAKAAPVADAPAVPAKHDPNSLAGEFCDLCALIHLAGTLVPAVAPALPVPAIFGSAPQPVRIDPEFAASRPLFFQARAPPLA
jgi:hypothetical protein